MECVSFGLFKTPAAKRKKKEKSTDESWFTIEGAGSGIRESWFSPYKSPTPGGMRWRFAFVGTIHESSCLRRRRKA